MLTGLICRFNFRGCLSSFSLLLEFFDIAESDRQSVVLSGPLCLQGELIDSQRIGILVLIGEFKGVSTTLLGVEINP